MRDRHHRNSGTKHVLVPALPKEMTKSVTSPYGQEYETVCLNNLISRAVAMEQLGYLAILHSVKAKDRKPRRFPAIILVYARSTEEIYVGPKVWGLSQKIASWMSVL